MKTEEGEEEWGGRGRERGKSRRRGRKQRETRKAEIMTVKYALDPVLLFFRDTFTHLFHE